MTYMTMTTTTLEVSQTILEQLGGFRFIAMTGARDLVGSPSSLSFRLGRNAGWISGVRVTLDPSDTYTMTFMRTRKSKVETVKECCNVYADQLQEIFREVTGLETRFNAPAPHGA